MRCVSIGNCHTVLTDTESSSPTSKESPGTNRTFRRHPFDRTCHVHGIEHQLTEPNHPWIKGQVERMNRTI